jgi:hypothetical protein
MTGPSARRDISFPAGEMVISLLRRKISETGTIAIGYKYDFRLRDWMIVSEGGL